MFEYGKNTSVTVHCSHDKSLKKAELLRSDDLRSDDLILLISLEFRDAQALIPFNKINSANYM